MELSKMPREEIVNMFVQNISGRDDEFEILASLSSLVVQSPGIVAIKKYDLPEDRAGLYGFLFSGLEGDFSIDEDQAWDIVLNSIGPEQVWDIINDPWKFVGIYGGKDTKRFLNKIRHRSGQVPYITLKKKS